MFLLYQIALKFSVLVLKRSALRLNLAIWSARFVTNKHQELSKILSRNFIFSLNSGFNENIFYGFNISNYIFVRNGSQICKTLNISTEKKWFWRIVWFQIWFNITAMQWQCFMKNTPVLVKLLYAVILLCRCLMESPTEEQMFYGKDFLYLGYSF